MAFEIRKIKNVSNNCERGERLMGGEGRGKVNVKRGSIGRETDRQGERMKDERDKIFFFFLFNY